MTTNDHPDQSKIVEQIHADFRNSQSIIISSLNVQLTELFKTEELEKQISRAEKMRALGFIQANGSDIWKSELDNRKKGGDEKEKFIENKME